MAVRSHSPEAPLCIPRGLAYNPGLVPEPLEPACCGACDHAASAGPDGEAIPPSPPLRARGWSLVISGREPGQSREIALSAPRFVIGRGGTADIVIQDPSLSRITCALVIGADEVFVEDLKSSCGTYVNGKKVIRSGLHENDVIRVGDTALRFRRSE